MDTSNVTNMEGLFYNCQSLTKWDFSKLNTSNVVNMSKMFAGCSKLTSFENLSTFDTASVTNMSGMFSDCTSLKELNLTRCFSHTCLPFHEFNFHK